MDLTRYIKDQNTLSPVDQPTTDPSSSLKAVANISKDIQGGIAALGNIQERVTQEDDTIKAMKMYDRYRRAQTDFSNRALEEGAGKILKEQEAFHNTFMAEAEAAGLSKKANEWLVTNVLKHGQEVYTNTTLLGVQQREQEKANATTQFVSSAAQDMTAPGADIPAILDNVRAGISSLYTDPSQAGKVSQAATDTLVSTLYDEVGQDYKRKDQLEAMYKSGYLLDQASPAAQAAIRNKQEKWRDLNREKSNQLRKDRYDNFRGQVDTALYDGDIKTAEGLLDWVAAKREDIGDNLLDNDAAKSRDADNISSVEWRAYKATIANMKEAKTAKSRADMELRQDAVESALMIQLMSAKDKAERESVMKKAEQAALTVDIKPSALRTFYEIAEQGEKLGNYIQIPQSQSLNFVNDKLKEMFGAKGEFANVAAEYPLLEGAIRQGAIQWASDLNNNPMDYLDSVVKPAIQKGLLFDSTLPPEVGLGKTLDLLELHDTAQLAKRYLYKDANKLGIDIAALDLDPVTGSGAKSLQKAIDVLESDKIRAASDAYKAMKRRYANLRTSAMKERIEESPWIAPEPAQRAVQSGGY